MAASALQSCTASCRELAVGKLCADGDFQCALNSPRILTRQFTINNGRSVESEFRRRARQVPEFSFSQENNWGGLDARQRFGALQAALPARVISGAFAGNSGGAPQSQNDLFSDESFLRRLSMRSPI
jgi:hypothetical protein